MEFELQTREVANRVVLAYAMTLSQGVPRATVRERLADVHIELAAPQANLKRKNLVEADFTR
jgi:hypothetical protein